jgi:Mg-chelatase subunit ChlD
MLTSNQLQQNNNQETHLPQVIHLAEATISAKPTEKETPQNNDTTLSTLKQDAATPPSSPWEKIKSSGDVLGLHTTTLSGSRCTLVMLLLDDSHSMAHHKATSILAMQTFVKRIADAKRSGAFVGDILVSVGTVNRGIVAPYTHITNFQMTALDDLQFRNYSPLYDAAHAACNIQIMTASELQAKGIQTNTVTLLITDGNDTGSILSSKELQETISKVAGTQAKNHIVATLQPKGQPQVV